LKSVEFTKKPKLLLLRNYLLRTDKECLAGRAVFSDYSRSQPQTATKRPVKLQHFPVRSCAAEFDAVAVNRTVAIEPTLKVVDREEIRNLSEGLWRLGLPPRIEVLGAILHFIHAGGIWS
jgi:hypothetical protein